VGWNVTRIVRRLRDWVVGLAILALTLLIIAKLENGQALRFSGTFLAVDGDTLVVEGERLRLEGIDAPELGQTCDRSVGGSYACGTDARQTLADLIKGRDWECLGTGRDRYERLLVTCRRGLDDLGSLLVRSGSAVADGRYLAEEAMARRDGKGIWGGAFERPSDWRRMQKLEDVEQMARLRTLLPRWIVNWFEE
jgi:endonuclease YncB( thermonuclease family)